MRCTGLNSRPKSAAKPASVSLNGAPKKLGRGMPEAVLLTKAYVAATIANAHPLGKGHGPVHHLYRMNQPARLVRAADASGAAEHE